jgi:general secretion pathway protein A
MYEKHFGFQIKPFQTIPNPEFFYPSPKHENALTYLEYGLMERTGFILLTGEIGSGKTTLVRYLLNRIEGEIDTAVIFNTNISADQLIGMILNEFEVTPSKGGKAHELDSLYEFLIERFSRNRRVLLIIDEAQNLDRDALEEVRMLSNLQSDDQMLIQIMLVGQPELRNKLRRPELAQLNQRITVAYHIPALSREETGEYIAFRLKKAGGSPDLFTKDAVDLVHKVGMGIPRTMNIVCDTALVYGYADEAGEITGKLIEQVIEDREGMGLVARPIEASGRQEAPADAGDLLPRIEVLEAGLARLQMQIDLRLEELERSAQGYKDDLVRQLKELYTLERKKNEKLILSYAKLKEQHLELMGKIENRARAVEGEEKKARESQPVAPSPSPEEFQALRRDMKKEAANALKNLAHHGGQEKKASTSRKKKNLLTWFKT